MAKETRTKGLEGQGKSRRALFGVALCGLLAALGTSIANVALPQIAVGLGASFQATQWVVLGYLLSSTCLVVAAGSLGDAFGRERLLRVGLVVFIAASLVCAMAPQLWVLVVGRLVQGVGAAILLSMSLALVGGLMPKETMGRGLGLYGSMSALGTALGPSIGGWLLEALGWRSVFGWTALVGVISFAVVWKGLPGEKTASSAGAVGFDSIGTMLLGVALATFSLAVMLRADGYGVINLWLLSLSVGSGLLFRMAEGKVARPIVRLSMLRSPCLRRDLMLTSVVAAVMMATLVVGPYYLSRALQLRPGIVGLVMSVGPLVVTVIGVPVGRWIDAIGTRKAARLGLGALGSGAVLLCVLLPEWRIKGYLSGIVLMTLGYGVFQTANNTGMVKQAAALDRGSISGLMNLARNLGLILGTAVMGSVFSASIGETRSMPMEVGALEAGVQIVFAIAALLIGFSLLWIRRLACPDRTE